MSELKFSASNLIKQSAKQTVYLNKKKERFKDYFKPITKRQIEGTNQQLRISTSEFIEMRGTYINADKTIYFSFDEIREKDNVLNFIEHKMISSGTVIEDWYLKWSIIQVAFYSALARNIDDFYTATFLRKKGHKTKYINSKGKYRINTLIFTCSDMVTEYEIRSLDDDAIIDFYLQKINHTTDSDYDKASEWDSKYKFKEWEYLSKYISYVKTKETDMRIKIEEDYPF